MLNAVLQLFGLASGNIYFRCFHAFIDTPKRKRHEIDYT